MSVMKKRWRLLVCFIILLVSLALVGFGVTTLVNHYDTTETALVTRVIDGDTIEIEGGFRVRYIGIDTPEKGDFYYEEATQKNSELVLGKKVKLEKDISEIDIYGRLLRYVYINDLFVNAELVRLGYAKAAEYPPDTKYADYFKDLEDYAIASDLGIHNKPYKPFQLPSFSLGDSNTNPFLKPTTNPFKTQEPAGVAETIYKANEVIEVVKASVPYFADAERSRLWAYPLYGGLTCSAERSTSGNKWEVIISGYRAHGTGTDYFSETWYFHEDTGEVDRSPF